MPIFVSNTGELHAWHVVFIVGLLVFTLALFLGQWLQRSRQERRQGAEIIRYQALHDALTGLPNRNLFIERLQMAIVRSRRGNGLVAVMVLGIDRFAEINNALGHVAGEEMLVAVARRLAGIVRQEDSLARYEGGQFLLLPPIVQKTRETYLVAGRVLESFKTPFEIKGVEIRVTASIGIALYPNDAADALQLLKNASLALSQAKERGGNNYRLYDVALNIKAEAMLKLRNDLRRAVEKQEFILYYQPQVEVMSGRLIGTEAVIRWIDPVDGLIPAARFIPAAEEAGLIEEIGEWVLRSACRQNQAWNKKTSQPLRIAVNLSARQFNKGLPRLIGRILRETELEPRLLELEVTESVAMRDPEMTRTIISKLKGLGVSIAIDNFGAGYSSLGYLSKFEIDVLKIDRSFLADVSANKQDAMLVAAIIRMAHALNLAVIAEGVESPAQFDFLKQQECDQAQGAGLMRPVPAAELEKFLRSGETTLTVPPA